MYRTPPKGWKPTPPRPAPSVMARLDNHIHAYRMRFLRMHTSITLDSGTLRGFYAELRAMGVTTPRFTEGQTSYRGVRMFVRLGVDGPLMETR